LSWASKLKEFNTRVEDLRMRNTIVTALIMQVQVGKLTAPFDRFPVNITSLAELQRMLPPMSAKHVFPEDFKLPQIMRQSPDQGAFLVTQPVPKCGAFCYLAVVSRPANK
jgi:Domain of unknown function (DUF4485)